MRFFKIRQSFYDASTAEGGDGGGDGKDKKPDGDGGEPEDEGIKKELEAIKADIKKIIENSSEKNTTLENIQKQIDKATDETSKQELINLKNDLVNAKNENIVLKLETYKLKIMEKEKISSDFAELVTITPDMKTEDIDKLIEKAKKIQDGIKQEIVTVNQNQNIAVGSGKKNKDTVDNFEKRLEEKKQQKEAKQEVPKIFS